MKKVILIFLSFLALTGCTPDEQAKYNEEKAFLGFIRSVYDLKVPINSSNSVDLVLRASNKSSEARTYNVEVISTETDANPLTFSVPATITIPAESYTGTLTVTGTDNNLVDANIKKITIRVTGFDANESFDSDRVVINMVEFCAINPATFVGDFTSSNFYNDGTPTVYEVVAGSAPNTLRIINFFPESPTDKDLVITYNPNDNNRVSFATRALGVNFGNGPVSIRMSTVAANVSSIDACTNKISLWIEYYLPNTNQTYGASGYNEVFTKL